MRLALLTALTSVAVVLAAGATIAAVGCSSSSGGAASDAGQGDECQPIDSACGQPCQAGNSLGVGRFCNNTTDCRGTKVPTLCATLGVPNEHFCTTMCSPADAGPDASFPMNCGENATCACQGNQCGCIPTACLHP
jgi:hypothetical protein